MTASTPAASASVTPSNSSEPPAPKPKVCKMCDKAHFIADCKAIKDMTVEKRNEFCKEKGMCFNCLNGGHRLYQCRVRSRCDECKGKHHTMLHSAEKAATQQKPTETPPVSTAMCATRGKSIYFPVVTVRVEHAGKHVTVRAVLDQCSDVTLCTGDLLNRLEIKGIVKPFTVNTVNGRKTDDTSVQADFEVTSLADDKRIRLSNVRSVKHLPVNVSSIASKKQLTQFSHLNDINLHQPDDDDVHLLIGSNCPEVFIIEDQRIGQPGEPIAQKYCFGWAVIGPAGKQRPQEEFSVNLQSEITNEQLSTQLEKMWNTEFSDAPGSNKRALSVEDSIAVKIVDPSIKKENGRYYVKMPFKTRPQDIPNNRSVAEKRLRYLKNKLIHSLIYRRDTSKLWKDTLKTDMHVSSP